MEERNVVTDGVHTKEEIEAKKAYTEKVWATFPDLCKAIKESETIAENGWEPTEDIVARTMINNDAIVRKAIDSKLK